MSIDLQSVLAEIGSSLIAVRVLSAGCCGLIAGKAWIKAQQEVVREKNEAPEPNWLETPEETTLTRPDPIIHRSPVSHRAVFRFTGRCQSTIEPIVGLPGDG